MHRKKNFLLISLLIAGLLSGCTPSAPPVITDPPTETTGAPETAAPPETTAATVPPETTAPPVTEPELTPAEKLVQGWSEQYDIPAEEWPEELVALLDRNPETEDYVLNYPMRGTWTEYTLHEDLSQGMPLFLQWDPRWGYLEYGSNVAALTACGPMCLSMVGYYISGGDETFAPHNMIAYAADHGYYAQGLGTEWALISQGGPALGLNVRELPLHKGSILEQLSRGNPIICAVGRGIFTESGHFLVLSGTQDGMIQIHDPNSRINSGKLWSYEEIADQIRNLWVIYNPNSTN